MDHILQSLAGREDDRGDRAPGATWWAADRLGRGLILNARAQVHPHKQLFPGPLKNRVSLAAHHVLSVAQPSWSHTGQVPARGNFTHSLIHSLIRYTYDPLLVSGVEEALEIPGGPSDTVPTLDPHLFLLPTPSGLPLSL